MKKLFGILFVAVAAMCVLNGCSNEDEQQVVKDKVYIQVQSGLDQSQIASIGEAIGKELDSLTRSDGALTITEGQAQNLVSPMVENGREMQETILAQLKGQGLGNTELNTEVQNLTDDELATLSFLSALEKTTTAKTDDLTMITNLEIPMKTVFTCVGVALGIYDIGTTFGNIFLSGSVEISGLIPLLKAIGKHYLGYVGLAVFIYNVVDCLESAGVL